MAVAKDCCGNGRSAAKDVLRGDAEDGETPIEELRVMGGGNREACWPQGEVGVPLVGLPPYACSGEDRKVSLVRGG